MHRMFELMPGCRILKLAAAVACCLSNAALAATITVDNGAASSVAGSCTIVDAVASVNQGSAVVGSSCVNTGSAFGTSDTINFSSNFNINFAVPAGNSRSALVLNKAVTISGNVNGAGKPVVAITRKNGANTRFRLIETSANLVLSGITIRGGDVDSDGGGVFVGADARVSINNSAIVGNSATVRGGGVYASNGLVTLNSTTVSGNTAPVYGGGVYSYAGATISHSTISGNSSGQGGGILSGGPFAADESTISGNTATYVGGGIYAFGKSVLTDTTISGNSATLSGGGISTGEANMRFCTITGNSVDSGGAGAGVYLRGNNNSASAALIFANQSGADIDGPPFVMSTLMGDHNLIGTHSSALSVPGDTKNCDPGLGSLSLNGGATQTRALSNSSCAIDAGPAFSSISADQRGYARKMGAATDIGAFEKQGPDDPDRIFSGTFDQ